MNFQVIATGDFKQLPPVPNRRFFDDGSYCFLSESFARTFPHHINLKEVCMMMSSIYSCTISILSMVVLKSRSLLLSMLNLLKDVQNLFHSNVNDE